MVPLEEPLLERAGRRRPGLHRLRRGHRGPLPRAARRGGDALAPRFRARARLAPGRRPPGHGARGHRPRPSRPTRGARRWPSAGGAWRSWRPRARGRPARRGRHERSPLRRWRRCSGRSGEAPLAAPGPRRLRAAPAPSRGGAGPRGGGLASQLGLPAGEAPRDRRRGLGGGAPGPSRGRAEALRAEARRAGERHRGRVDAAALEDAVARFTVQRARETLGLPRVSLG